MYILVKFIPSFKGHTVLVKVKKQTKSQQKSHQN